MEIILSLDSNVETKYKKLPLDCFHFYIATLNLFLNLWEKAVAESLW